ncbi:unnamed protein product [Citrullus colocynthis]|uniref:Uncharacterized protein n=1 Tax=Citrullus colocynthis TaxID=252529 RepID=A0ABP0Y200_9ROSI
MTKKISNFNGVSPSELFKPNSRRNHPPNLNRRNRLHRIIVLQSPPPTDLIAEKQLTIPSNAFQLPSPGDPRHCSPQKPGPTAGNFRSLHLRPTPSPTDRSLDLLSDGIELFNLAAEVLGASLLSQYYLSST